MTLATENLAKHAPLYAPKSTGTEAFEEAVKALREICRLPANALEIFEQTANTLYVDASALPYADWKEIPRHGRIWHINQETGVLHHKKTINSTVAAREKALSDIVWHSGFPVASTLLDQQILKNPGNSMQVFSPAPDSKSLPLRDFVTEQGGEAKEASDFAVIMTHHDSAFAASYLAMWVSDLWTGNYDRHCDNIIVTTSTETRPHLTYYGFDANQTTNLEDQHDMLKVCAHHGQEKAIREGKSLYPNQHSDIAEMSLRAIENFPHELIQSFHERVASGLGAGSDFCKDAFNNRSQQLILRQKKVRPFLKSHSFT